MQEIIDSLNGLGYQGECLDESAIEDVLQNGLNSPVFRSLVSWLTTELHVLLNLDEQIHPDGEIMEFALELSSLLKELGCPYSVLISGPTAKRFQTRQDNVLLLNFLTSELMAAKMCHKLNPQKKVVIDILESPAAIALKLITQNLNLGKPPQNIAPSAYFEKLLNRFTEVYKKNEKEWGKPLFAPNKQLTFEEWKKLDQLQKDLDSEYNLRREMLITRLDVTIQSFQWSDAVKNKGDIIAERYAEKRKELDSLQSNCKATDIADLLAARDDLLYVEKTSSANVRKNTQTNLQKHIIGMVPDRGGRAREMQPPPPEMPSWQKNRAGGSGGGQQSNRGGGNFYKGQNPQQQRNFQQQQNYQNSYSGNNYQNQSGGDGRNYQQNKSYNNRGGGNSRVQGGWSQSGGNSRDYGNQNQQRNDNYYNSGGNNSGNNRNNYYGQQQNDGYNRSGDNYNRGGQSNYNRGGRR